jgi:hypothetical protein
VVDDLPEGRGAGTARAVDGRHGNCAYEQYAFASMSADMLRNG